MIFARQASSTTTPDFPAVVSVRALDRRGVQAAAVFAAFFSTATPTVAATTRFEDTALRARPSFALTEDSAAVSRIRTLAAYEAGWDGPESVGPTLETVKQAIAFAHELHALGEIVQPRISLAGDGEINFYWKTPRLVLDLGFTGTGRYSYYGRTPDGVEFVADEAELGHGLPPDLIAVLRV